jgi:hypothetical protein
VEFEPWPDVTDCNSKYCTLKFYHYHLYISGKFWKANIESSKNKNNTFWN